MDDRQFHLLCLTLPIYVLLGTSIFSVIRKVARRACAQGPFNTLIDGFLALTVVHQIYYSRGLADADAAAIHGFGGYFRLFLLPLLMVFATQVLLVDPPPDENFPATLARLRIFYLILVGVLVMVALQGLALWHQPLASWQQFIRLAAALLFLAHVFAKKRARHLRLLIFSTLFLLTYIIVVSR